MLGYSPNLKGKLCSLIPLIIVYATKYTLRLLADWEVNPCQDTEDYLIRGFLQALIDQGFSGDDA